MAIKVLKPGLSTTVQDLGRPGYYHIGIPLRRNGSACARRRNLLVGNAEGAAVLEAVFMGPALEFTDAPWSRSRAPSAPKLDGVPGETWASFKGEARPKTLFDS